VPKPLIVTAATANSPYEKCLEKQKAIYGDGIVTFLFPETTWAEGTKIKPNAIMQALQITDTVLWIDADCAVQLPEEDPPAGDVLTTENIHPNHINRISAAFILFRKHAKTEQFLRSWAMANRRHKKDHSALMQTIRRMDNLTRIRDMTEWLKNRHQINVLLPERGVY